MGENLEQKRKNVYELGVIWVIRSACQSAQQAEELTVFIYYSFIDCCAEFGRQKAAAGREPGGGQAGVSQTC